MTKNALPTVANSAGQTVLVRTKRLIPELFAIGATLRVPGLAGDPSAAFEIREANDEEKSGYFPNARYVCVLDLERTPKPKAIAALRDLWEDRIPEGVDRSKLPEYELPKFEIPLDWLPNPLRVFITSVYDELGPMMHTALAKVSWRANIAIPPYTVHLGRPLWSLDGGLTWRMLAANNVAYMPKTNMGLWQPLYPAVVATLRDATRHEPLGHELWREAWNLRGPNPQSALLIGVTALETGIKELIAAVLPGTTWLVANAPTPPVERILSEYLPTLSSLKGGETASLAIPGTIVKECRKWITIRNELTHGRSIITGRNRINDEQLDEFLLVVHDLLWLFDYVSGVVWAKDHIRPATWESIASTSADRCAAAKPRPT